jgi:hypothetical protein
MGLLQRTLIKGLHRSRGHVTQEAMQCLLRRQGCKRHCAGEMVGGVMIRLRTLMPLEWPTEETKDPGEEFLEPGTAFRLRRVPVSRAACSVQLRWGPCRALPRQAIVLSSCSRNVESAVKARDLACCGEAPSPSKGRRQPCTPSALPYISTEPGD